MKALWFSLVLFAAMEGFGATYYVATTGNDANDGSSGTPWRTIAFADTQVVAGDTVIVAAGDYRADGVTTLDTDGTAENKITYYGSSRGAQIRALILNSLDHVRIVSFTVDGENTLNDLFSFVNCTYVEVWDCSFKDSNRQHIGMDSGGKTTASSQCIIAKNEFFYGTGGLPRYMQIRGANNLIEYNIFHSAFTDYIYFFGSGNIIRNNYGYDPDPYTGGVSQGHVDFLQTGADAGQPVVNTTIEANLYIDGTETDHHHLSNMSNSGADFTGVLLRRNIAHEIGTGVHNIFENFSGFYMYHEGYLGANRAASDATTAYSVWTSGTVDNPRVWNSMFYEAWGASVTTPQGYLLDGVNESDDYNLGYDAQGTTTFAGELAGQENGVLNSDPAFVNYAANNFQIGSGSGARDAGGAPMTVSSVSGSGTTVTLNDAGFIRGDNTNLSQYGGALVTGDTITIGTDVVTVVSISGNDVTFTPSITWAQNDLVYWGSDTTPDIGAMPYTATTHEVAGTYALAGTEMTVTLTQGTARGVYFFKAGLPVGYDSSAPYVHADADEAWIQNLYASATPAVEATTAAGGGGVSDVNVTELRIGTIEVAP